MTGRPIPIGHIRPACSLLLSRRTNGGWHQSPLSYDVGDSQRGHRKRLCDRTGGTLPLRRLTRTTDADNSL